MLGRFRSSKIIQLLSFLESSETRVEQNEQILNFQINSPRICYESLKNDDYYNIS